MNVNAHRTGQRIVTTPRTGPRSIRKRFGVTGTEALLVHGGLSGTVIAVNSHGSNPWTRYNVAFDDGTVAVDLHEGEHFAWAPPMNRRETAVAAANLRRAFAISPHMEQSMIAVREKFADDPRPPVGGGARTERALIDRELAVAVRGGALGAREVYAGARLTGVGAHVARVLAAAASSPGRELQADAT